MIGELTILENNFKASAIGCGIPAKVTLFGPFRSCE